MEETIHGTVMQVLELSLQPGESVISEAGEFSWMTDAMTFSTGAGGGTNTCGACGGWGACGACTGGAGESAWGVRAPKPTQKLALP